MKKFIIPCDFNGTKSPFTVYIGAPKTDHHPIHFQSDWLSKQRGGTVPPEVMDSLSKLRDLADQNGVSFEELCVYALGTAQQETEEETSLETEEVEYDQVEELDEDKEATDDKGEGEGEGEGGGGGEEAGEDDSSQEDVLEEADVSTETEGKEEKP